MLLRLVLGVVRVFRLLCWTGTPGTGVCSGGVCMCPPPNQPFCPQRRPEPSHRPLPRHLPPCDSHILSPELIWIKPCPTSQQDAAVNFNLTQIPINLLVTAVPVCLSAVTEPRSISVLQFPSHPFGSSLLLLFTKCRVWILHVWKILLRAVTSLT